MMVPFAAIMIPLFRMFSKLKMVNTMAAFMLPSISTPFMIMMFRQASRSFPHDIIEAARLDGLSEIGIFFRMFIPNLLSGYVVDYGMLMLGVLICTIPTVIIFFFFQKSFAEGITGAVK